MKLKQRIVLLSIIFTWFVLSLSYIIYHYVQTFQSSVIFLSTDTASKVENMKLRLAQKDLMRAHTRRLKKESRMTLNSSMYDSNKAAEVELNDTEYEDILNKWGSFVQNLDLPLTLLNKTVNVNVSTVVMGFTPECSEEVMQRNPGEKRERFPDLLQLLSLPNPLDVNLKKTRITLQEIHGIENMENFSYLDKFHVSISDLDLYTVDDPNVEALLHSMATQPIVHVEEKQGGTQLKLIVTFQDGSQALFKPMRFDRDKETDPNHFYFVDYERHTSEIASFHLDRILGFRRCPPVVGRKLNITSEIYAVAEEDLIKTFFISPAKNVCFHGTCSYYCDTGHAICGRPDSIEGSLAAFLPPDTLSGRKSWKNPWRRSYHKRRKADFERIPRYCEVVREHSLYRNSKRLADLVDTSVLDFLIGNMDRHHYETFKIFGNDSFIVHLDHGRGFGKPNHDEISILAPLYQCCFINFATFERLTVLHHNSVPLSSLMRCSLSRDSLSPILLEKHLRALDRRLETVLHFIKDCLMNHKSKEVFYVDSSEWTPVS